MQTITQEQMEASVEQEEERRRGEGGRTGSLGSSFFGRMVEEAAREGGVPSLTGLFDKNTPSMLFWGLGGWGGEWGGFIIPV